MEPVVVSDGFGLSQQAPSPIDQVHSATLAPNVTRGSPNLIRYIESVYGTEDLAGLNPLQGMGKPAADRARTKTINVPMVFKGSASSFHNLVQAGYPIKMTVAQALDGRLSKLNPNRQIDKDKEQQLNPVTSFDLTNALINKITIVNPLNTMPQSVGLKTNGLPAAYAELRKQQTEELKKDFGGKVGDVDIVAHIPTSEDRVPDTKPIPIIKEIITGFHGIEVSKTFGGITANHMSRGVIPLPPDFAKSLGLMAPPLNHQALKAPEGYDQGVNSWVIVPMGHVLSHIVNLTASEIVTLDYCVFRLTLPNGVLLPFLLMDTWTYWNYVYGTVSSAVVKIDSSRANIYETFIELVPVSRGTWLNSCMAGEHLRTGLVSFTLVMTYTVFPSNFREDDMLICSLSAGFPRISFEMKKQLDEAHERADKQSKAEEQMMIQHEKDEARKAGRKKK